MVKIISWSGLCCWVITDQEPCSVEGIPRKSTAREWNWRALSGWFLGTQEKDSLENAPESCGNSWRWANFWKGASITSFSCYRLLRLEIFSIDKTSSFFPKFLSSKFGKGLLINSPWTEYGFVIPPRSQSSLGKLALPPDLPCDLSYVVVGPS